MLAWGRCVVVVHSRCPHTAAETDDSISRLDGRTLQIHFVPTLVVRSSGFLLLWPACFDYLGLARGNDAEGWIMWLKVVLLGLSARLFLLHLAHNIPHIIVLVYYHRGWLGRRSRQRRTDGILQSVALPAELSRRCQLTKPLNQEVLQTLFRNVREKCVQIMR